MMQCYSAAGNHGAAWRKLAVRFVGYKNPNILMLDFSPIKPWTWLPFL